MTDLGREPCPYRIIDDIGGAFAMGAVGGSLFHAYKGFRTSARGDKLLGARLAVMSRGPVLGGNFGVWGFLFSTYDCTFAGIRGKEDPWNAIAAGGFTGATLAARSGVRASVTAGVVGTVLLGLIEVVGLTIQRMTSGAAAPVAPQLPPGVLDDVRPSEPVKVVSSLPGSVYEDEEM